VGSVLDAANFYGGLYNTGTGGVVPYSAVVYDDATHTVTLTIDTSDPDWLPGSSYQIKVLSSVWNRCGVAQGIDVVRSFTTMSAISGQVRVDLDGDGDLADLDDGLSGVTIELEDPVCTLGVDCPTMATGTNGYYRFIDLAAGSYIIHETDLAGYESTNDFDGTNDNAITVSSLLASQNVTGRDFLDAISCSAPNPITGFVVSTSPSDGQTGVPLSPATITVIFNQPMYTQGSSGAGNPTNYSLWNSTQGSSVNINSVTYYEDTYTVVIGINPSSSKWAAGQTFIFTIKTWIENRCGTSQSVNVLVNFETAP